MHCFGDLSKDPDQIRTKELEQNKAFEAPPEPKVELSAPVVLQDEVFEMDQADSNPVSVEKVRPANAKKTARKADMSAFDREKFYKRIGVDLNQVDSDKQEV